jgi:hypothetical protein
MMLQCMILEVIDIATKEACHYTGRVSAWEWLARRYAIEVLCMHMSREYEGTAEASRPDIDA